MTPDPSHSCLPVTIRLDVEAEEVRMHGPDGRTVYRRTIPGLSPTSTVDLDLGISGLKLSPGRVYRAVLHRRLDLITGRGVVHSLSDVAECRP